MPNFASALRQAIRRLARRETRSLVAPARRAVAQHRRVIAELKRQVGAQEKKLAFLEAQERVRVARTPLAVDGANGARFSAKWLRAHRKRVKLAAHEYARLVGVSSQSIYLWERGQTKPGKQALASLAAARKLGRREAKARLEMLGKPGR